MASLRDCARCIREEAADGIAWIAVWKEGRSWKAEAIFPDDFYLESGCMILSTDDLAVVQEAVKADPNAIFVNGYYSNIGCYEDDSLPDVQILADALRWQYEDCHPLISEWELKESVIDNK